MTLTLRRPHMLNWSLALGAAACPGLFEAARADTVEIGASQDNTLYESESGALSNGEGKYFFVGRTNQGPDDDQRRGLIAFDVASAVPPGSTITAATLTLSLSKAAADDTVTVELHRILNAWGEGASNAPGQEGAGDDAAAGDATWIHTLYDTDLWDSPGGDFVASASAATAVGSQLTFYEWSDAAMIADVQSWLDDPSGNHGWLVLGDESGPGTARRFDSRESNSQSSRPKLTIEYETGAATGACCFDDGACDVIPEDFCLSQGGSFAGEDVSCEDSNCPAAGACCLPGDACMVLTSAACAKAGGAYQGDGTTCMPNPCLPDEGACCLSGAACVTANAEDCDSMGGIFLGGGTDCATDECPLFLTPFLDPLPLPAVAQPVSGEPGGAAHYEIAMTQFQQQLHADLAPTTVWGYGGTYPGPTIEARVDELVTVEWINDLRDENGALRTDHYLPVDLCPHGAVDLPKAVVHLHGGHVEDDSDGDPEETFLPGESSPIYEYPNNQPPATIWYHDHGLGITRLNVYMGLAAFYLIRDDFEDALGLPSGEYEIPMAIQDRSFNNDGTLKYPEVWQDHFFGDFLLVNGKVWPYLEVDRGLYRFRVLNGSNSRVYALSLSDGAPFLQIGTDGGLLPAPVEHTELVLAGGERAELVMDFSGYAPGTEIILMNSAPAPYPGTPGEGVIPEVMKFIVTADEGYTVPVPDELRPVEPIDEALAVVERDLELRKVSDPCAGQIWLINGLLWDDITEFPILNTVEVWSFINRSGQIHPMHMHLVFFQVLDRQAFEIIDEEIVPIGDPMPPKPEEEGWKDTVQAPPFEITRVIVRFEDYVGRFPYHCHILEHEDHEMMRQFEVIACPGDVNHDAVVDVSDLVEVILNWGPCPPEDCVGDTNGDGIVDVTDLVEVILGWGDC